MIEGDLRATLLNVFEKHFFARDVFEAFLKETIDLNLDDIETGNLTVSRTAVLNTMDVDEARKVIDKLKSALAAGTELRMILDAIVLPPSADEVDPTQYCYADNKPFINRSDLRAALRAVARDDGPRILVVQGHRFSGKSHAREHVEQLAAKLSFKYVEFPLLEYSSGPEEIRPYDLGVAIVDRMGLTLPERLDAKAARWSQNFLNWLAGQLDQKNERWWIVIDDFEGDKVKVPDSIYEFIDLLATRIFGPLSRLRLVLISYERELPPLLRVTVKRETVKVISDEDLLQYFLDFYRDFVPAGDPEAEGDALADRIRRIRARMDCEPALQLFEMRAAVKIESDGLLGGGNP
jgi:hypothetical protein